MPVARGKLHVEHKTGGAMWASNYWLKGDDAATWTTGGNAVVAGEIRMVSGDVKFLDAYVTDTATGSKFKIILPMSSGQSGNGDDKNTLPPVCTVNFSFMPNGGGRAQNVEHPIRGMILDSQIENGIFSIYENADNADDDLEGGATAENSTESDDSAIMQYVNAVQNNTVHYGGFTLQANQYATVGAKSISTKL